MFGIIFFRNVLNRRIGRDCTEHVICRVDNLSFPAFTKYAIIHCGTKNIKFNNPTDIATGCNMLMIANDLSYNTRSFLSSEIENIFIEIFYLIQSFFFWVLFITHRVKVVLLKQLLNIFQRLTQTIQKYMF